MDYKQIAKEVIEALGGRENVNSVAHCATRLRVMVKDENKINKEKAENIEKVQGAFFNSGQYQMIFGTGTVNKIYDEIVAQGLPTASKDEQKAEAAKQGNWFQRAIRSFGDVFVPLLPAIVATGLFMGIRGAINNDTVLALFGTTSKAFAATDFYTYTVVLTDTAFAFFPALICWSAFNIFGGSPLLGLVLGLMMVNNALPNAWDVASGAAKPIYFFDFIPVVGYQNSVLPAFFVGLLGAKFEQWVRKWVPDVLDLLVVFFELGTIGCRRLEEGAVQKRHAELLREPACDLVTAAAVLAPDGNDDLSVHRIEPPFNSGVPPEGGPFSRSKGRFAVSQGSAHRYRAWTRA